MLYVPTELKENLTKALRYADKINLQQNLLACLHRMGQEWNEKPYVCFLYYDLAPYSFGFGCFDLDDCEITKDMGDTVITRKHNAKCWMNGGLIYHGPLDDGKESEPFCVQLVKRDGWSINT